MSVAYVYITINIPFDPGKKPKSHLLLGFGYHYMPCDRNINQMTLFGDGEMVGIPGAVLQFASRL